MNVDVIGVCRGGAKVFFRLSVKDLDPGNLVSLSAHADGMSIPVMAFEQDRCAPVSHPSSARDFIVIVPQLRIDVELSVQALSPTLEPIACSDFVLKPFEAKWRSRVNRVLHPGTIASIRNCDLERTLGRAVITFKDCVVVHAPGKEGSGHEECIYHGTAYVPSDLSASEMTIACFDGFFKGVDALFTHSPVRKVVKSPDKTVPMWEMDFAMRVPASLNGFTVVAANEAGERIVGFESVSDKQIAGLRKNVEHYSVNAGNDAGYHRWLLVRRPSRSALEIQRAHRFPVNPTFSIIVKQGRIDGDHLRATIDSIMAQTYPQLEVVLAVADRDVLDGKLGQEGLPDDSRIVISETVGDDASRMREALASAHGDFIAFIRSGDMLESDALYEYAKALDDDPSAKAVYCDEDRLLADGTFAMPILKPDFSIDYLRSTDYVGGLLAVRSEIARSIDIAYDLPDGLREYDYVLKVAERTRDIAHVGRVLMHRRIEDGKSAGESPSASDVPAREAEVIRSHLDRLGLAADVSNAFAGSNRVDYRVTGNPLVSIIIPSKDSSEMLSRCIASIAEKTLYANYEVIVVENNSSEASTFDCYERIQADDARVRVVSWPGEGFNYSSLVNFGAAQARGEYLLLLNNDIEVISPDWIDVMLGYCQREDIGAVGVKLRFPDETVQHAGVVVTNGSLEHIGHHMPIEERGYLSLLCQTRNVSAVTGACMMVSRESFDALGGFDEAFAVTYNDVDFCLRLHEKGKLVTYIPFVELYHHESVSRGRDDAGEKRVRVMKEWSLFWYRWPDYYVNGDPYFNSQFDQHYTRAGYHHLRR